MFKRQVLVPDFSSNPLINQSKMKDIIEKGYFTINNHIYRLDEDKWDVGASLQDLHPNNDSYWFDFSAFDIETGYIIKLWIYFELNPYKESETLKLAGIRHKLNSMARCYNFLKENNLEEMFLSPNYHVVQLYRNYLKKYSYFQQKYYSKIVYLKLLQFVENIFHIEQNDDAIELLGSFDLKKLKAEAMAKTTEAIENGYFKKIYKVCFSAIEDNQLKPELRIVAAMLILLSQTGLRKGELFSIDVQPIQNIVINDKENKQIDIAYIYAYTYKNIRGKDTQATKVKVPLTSDAKRAYLFLLAFCKERREAIQTKQLIVFPLQKKRIRRSMIGYRYSSIFYLHFHKELGNINVQEQYPELTTLCITPDMPNMTKMLYSSLVEYYGTDNLILSYPVFHQYRKTFATMLYQNGHTVEIISKLLHHYSPRITEGYYIRPKFNQKDYATTKKTYDSIIKHKSNVLGRKSADFTKRLQEYIDSDEVSSICKTDDELVDYMSKNHPLHAKDVGFCLLSDIYPCTVRSDEERMMCAFNTCPNIGFMFYNLVEHYQQMKNYEKSITLNQQEGLELAAQKEANRLKYLLKTFLIPELNETAKEIAKHGRDQILDWYPEMGGILNELDKIRDEIMSHQKEYEVTV